METNEALALRLQQGDSAAAEELWEQTRGWAYHTARRYLPAAARNNAVDMEDLMQSAFIGMLEAVRAYDAERGGFATVMKFYVGTECQQLLGLRGRERREHYEAASLDAPLTSSSEFTLSDVLEDTAGPDMAALLEGEEMRRDVRAAVDRLPGREQAVIRRVYLDGVSMQAVATNTGDGYSSVNTAKANGLRLLRRDGSLRDWYEPRCYTHKGVRAFRSSRSSTVEDSVLWLEEMGI